MSDIILIAGATGNLGGKIVNALLAKGATVRALVRTETNEEKVEKLRNKGVEIVRVDMSDEHEIAKACNGVSCVVSALSGLREVIVDAQKTLLDGAVEAGVSRFIPSVYSLDFTNLIYGRNRNLDLRREFNEYLEDAPIASTTIFNGAFMDLLTTNMPFIFFKFRRILYWGDSSVKMDLTTTFNVAEYAANAALDNEAPKYLRIAGDSVSAYDLKEIMSDISGKRFRLFRAGSIKFLNLLIKIAKFFQSGKHTLYPAWQGMQYVRDMLEGRALIEDYDNDRYPGIDWTSVKEFLLSQNVKKLV